MIKNKSKEQECCNSNGCCKCWKIGSGNIYGLGVLGAAVYFISQQSGFWMVVLAILKALVWPAFVVYELLRYFGS